MSVIDDTSYDEGVDAFRDGMSLRAIAKMYEIADVADDADAEDKFNSFAIGFLDGALDALRGLPEK